MVDVRGSCFVSLYYILILVPFCFLTKRVIGPFLVRLLDCPGLLESTSSVEGRLMRCWPDVRSYVKLLLLRWMLDVTFDFLVLFVLLACEKGHVVRASSSLLTNNSTSLGHVPSVSC